MARKVRMAGGRAERNNSGGAMTMIRDDEELAVQQRLLGVVEGIVESWRKELLPHNPKNFALYAEGAIEQADILRAEINAYLARKDAKNPDAPAPQPFSGHQPTNVA
jgi:hypothetical protein